MGVLYKDGAPVAEYITTDDVGKKVLTAKGKLLIYIQNNLSSKDGDSVGWLMLFMALANALGMDEDYIGM
jgi:hypothetical protein